MAERWKPIDGYEGLYEVSDQGRVRRLDTFRDMPPSRRHPDGWSQRVAGRVLRAGRSPSGHLTVALCRDGKPRSHGVHALVCAAFNGAGPSGLEVRHINGNPSDNRAVNLAWGTHAENMADRRTHGTDPQLNKTHCPQGHAYTAENTRIYRNHRICRRCHTLETNRRYHATKQLKGPPPKKTHCVNGHALEGNQYPSNRGCITCVKDRARLRKSAGDEHIQAVLREADITITAKRWMPGHC